MTFLLDTNIIGELRKGPRCNPNVAAWYAPLEDEDLHLSVLVLGEIERGVERLRRHDPVQAAKLERWLRQVRRTFAGRIHPVDDAVAAVWGRMGVPDPVPVIDGLLAATAQVRGLILATRNVRDIARTGVAYLNPFEPAP